MTENEPRHLHLGFRQIVALGALLWLIAWVSASPVSQWLAIDVLRLDPGSDLGRAVTLFLFNVPEVLLLLMATVMVATFVQSYFPPERLRAALAHRSHWSATVAAAVFGVLTPLDSCSAVPIFRSFVKAGIPMGATFAFLISSPMLNAIALLLLWDLLGPLVTVAYVAAGLAVAVAGGLVLDRLGVERWIEPSVRDVREGGRGTSPDVRPTIEQRVGHAWAETVDLVRTALPWVVLGIGAAAFIYGFVPADFVTRVGGRDNPYALPIAILIAIPLYSNAAGTIPIVAALVGKTLPVGTTLAFMMAISALSLPGFVILRRFIRPPLIALFTGVVAAGIFIFGLLFNVAGL
jgi:uncharacterized membrane protein YraQ (UPF0718 family)